MFSWHPCGPPPKGVDSKQWQKVVLAGRQLWNNWGSPTFQTQVCPGPGLPETAAAGELPPVLPVLSHNAGHKRSIEGSPVSDCIVASPDNLRCSTPGSAVLSSHAGCVFSATAHHSASDSDDCTVFDPNERQQPEYSRRKRQAR